MSWILSLIGGVSEIFKMVSDVLRRLHENKLVEQGKQQGKTELEKQIVVKENEIARKQAEVLMQERTEQELKDKLKNGSF